MLVDASHGVVSDPTRLLRRADAPRDLIAWTSGRAIDELWDECDRGDWLMWLAIVENVPLVAIVEAAEACARRAVHALPSDSKREPLSRALKAARELESGEICEKRARACEKIAGKVEAAGYRDTPPQKYEWAAAGAACAARSAEALLAAEARRSAERDFEGRIRAAGIGAGDQIISRGEFPPLVFEPDDELMAMCIHGAETAVTYASRALAPLNASGEQLEGVEGELSEVVFDILDPIRTGLREGKSAASLVRVLEIEPYGATSATRARRGDELTTIDDIGKRPLNALLAGLAFPLGGGHLYAGHTTTGAVLLAGGAMMLIGNFVGALSGFGFLTIMVADLITAPKAVRQRNAGETPSTTKQLAYGFGAVILALLVGLSGL
jgi:hypothetical protein